ncbi:Hypothetical predicted protein [Octopus vulgaris]|uniref:Uncharacterized protein n=1 Tax=Octopus vulgaris TaxID=6645 RepID=A0AA36BUR8_OCTVU|nr:Hypothetical predicted protein [Octopus vulgaris]
MDSLPGSLSGIPLGCYKVFMAKEAHCTSDNSYDKNFKQHESFRLHEYNASNSAICLDRKLREHQGQTAITVHKKYR